MKSQFKIEFAKLLDNTKTPSSLSQEEHIKALRKLHDFVQPHIPSKLFRFRISFEQGTIQMCIAEKFSDIYDSNIFYDYKSLSDRIESSYILAMSNVVRILKNNPKGLPDSNVKNKILELINSNITDNEIINAVKIYYGKFIERIKSEIEKQEIWPRNNTLTKIGCFTERIDSKFMWDHYADGYKGFALEYDFRKWYMLDVNLYPIIYSNQMLDATK